MSVDPKIEIYSSWSPYNYALNAPLNLIDENGENPNQFEIIWQQQYSQLNRALNEIWDRQILKYPAVFLDIASGITGLISLKMPVLVPISSGLSLISAGMKRNNRYYDDYDVHTTTASGAVGLYDPRAGIAPGLFFYYAGHMEMADENPNHIGEADPDNTRTNTTNNLLQSVIKDKGWDGADWNRIRRILEEKPEN